MHACKGVTLIFGCLRNTKNYITTLTFFLVFVWWFVATPLALLRFPGCSVWATNFVPRVRQRCQEVVEDPKKTILVPVLQRQKEESNVREGLCLELSLKLLYFSGRTICIWLLLAWLPDLWMNVWLEVTLFWLKLSCFSYASDAVLMLISSNLHKKSSEVPIETTSLPAPFSFKNRATMKDTHGKMVYLRMIVRIFLTHFLQKSMFFNHVISCPVFQPKQKRKFACEWNSIPSRISLHSQFW